MKVSVVIFGIFVGVVGLFSFWSTANWVLISNPFSFLDFFNPYYQYFIVGGVIIFLVGLALGGGKD